MMADASSPYPELPTIAGAFEAITQSIGEFVEKFQTIEIEEMGNSIENILSGADKLVNKDINEEAVTDLQASMRALSNVLKNVDEGDLDTTIAAARDVLVNLQDTLKMINDVLEPHSPLQHNVIKVMDELEEMSRATRSLIETLERQPNSIIFGRNATEDEQ
jgi:paraquat-inducible protein B